MVEPGGCAVKTALMLEYEATSMEYSKATKRFLEDPAAPGFHRLARISFILWKLVEQRYRNHVAEHGCGEEAHSATASH